MALAAAWPTGSVAASEGVRRCTGGIPTARDEIENEILPAFLGYYEQYQGYGFWATIEKPTLRTPTMLDHEFDARVTLPNVHAY